jgi:hypothetical protein
MKILILLILVCSIGNAQWERVPEIPARRVVYSLFAFHDTLYAGTDSLVYVGARQGTQWSAGIAPFTGADGVSSFVKIRNVLVAGTFQSGIYTSTDDGFSWKPFDGGLSGLGSLSIGGLLVRRDSLIAGTLGEGVFITASDFNHPWSPWGDSIPDYEGENIYRLGAIGNTVLAGGGANGYMFRYDDAEPWWNPIDINTPRRVGQTVSGMASSDSVVVAGTSKGVYRSTDQGRSWSRTTIALPPQENGTFNLYYGSTFFTAINTITSATMLISSDQGQTWSPPVVLPVPYVYDLAGVGDTLYLATAGGLWRAPLSKLFTSAPRKATSPSVFGLRQNYPNPFNPSTRIPFSIRSEGFVTLKIFDLLGREVRTLVHENLHAGNYERVFDASGLSGGVYVYRLESGGAVESRKLLLLK